MPNWVDNRLSIRAPEERVSEILKAIGYDRPRRLNRAYDGAIICRPRKKSGEYPHGCGYWDEERKIFRFGPGTGEDQGKTLPEIPQGWCRCWLKADRVWIDFERIVPPPDTPAYRDEPAQEAVKEDPDWWYTWNREHWGTKWNACDSELYATNCIRFQTAWTAPVPVIQALSDLYPDVEFLLESEDPGMGWRESFTFPDGLA
jgi:hypothetical protein